MYKIEQVLVPVDFSSFSRAALSFARSLGEHPPRVHLAHILAPWRPYLRRAFFPYAALGEDDVEFEQELMEEARRSLLKHLQIELDKEKFIADFSLEYGNIRDTLAARARKIGPDLIVMGAYGEGGVQPHLLGSTAEKLLRSAHAPTLLVRDFGRTPAVKHIVVGVDLSPNSPSIISRALSLALLLGADLQLVYVLPDPLLGDTNKLLARAIKVDSDKILSRSRARIEALFERVIDQVDVDFPAQDKAQRLLSKRKLIVGDPAHALIDYADAVDADLIVAGAHSTSTPGTRRLGRVAWNIARSAPTHVMVVPPERQVALLSDDDN